MKDLKIAAACMHSKVGRIQENLDRTEALAQRASRMGVDLICFPELSITGYVLDDPLCVYEGSPGPAVIVDRVVAMAKKRGLVILAGLIEESVDGRPYISHVVAGPEGLKGLYRKTHLSPQEGEKYRAGDEIPVFSHKETVFGVQLCYEAHFPEISTVMALKGAEMIFMPHASPRGTPEQKTQSWMRHLTSRAFDNALYVVACNQVGRTREGFSFPGVVLVLDASGNVRAHYGGDGEELVTAELSGAELKKIRDHRMRYFIPCRRPELYADLCR
jgi:N-carbamoylputrescine amidase